jgi:hypothetical protein
MNPEQIELLQVWLKSVGLWYYTVRTSKPSNKLVIYKWDERKKRKYDLCEIEMKEFTIPIGK